MALCFNSHLDFSFYIITRDSIAPMSSHKIISIGVFSGLSERLTPLMTALLLLSCLLLGACSNTSKAPNKELNEQQLYQQARKALDSNSLLLAADKLRQLETLYPFGQYAEQAKLELIYIDYMTANLQGALIGSERFIQLNPLHPQVDYAHYMRGLITYEMGFGFSESYLSDDVAKRDIAPLEDAFRYFKKLIERFPNSNYADDAHQRMLFLRDRLAGYELGIARYYMKRHAYIAAANRALEVVTQFPSSQYVADGLAIMTEAYRELGMNTEADKSLKLLTFNYPQHPQLQQGEFQASGLTEVDRRSFLSIITFGLID